MCSFGWLSHESIICKLALFPYSSSSPTLGLLRPALNMRMTFLLFLDAGMVQDSSYRGMIFYSVIASDETC